jgi:hypothetical protein
MVRRDARVGAFGLLFLALACRPPVPQQVIVPEPAKPEPPPVVVALPITTGPWSWSPVRERRSWMVTQRAIVTTRADSGLARVDTVSSELTTAFTQFVQALRISGSLTAYRVGTGTRAAVAPVGLTLPMTLAATSTAAPSSATMPSWTFTAPLEGTPCSSSAWSVAQGVRDLWYRTPDWLKVGTIWTDSASYTICRDAIPLRMHVDRTFRVTAVREHQGRAILTLVRDARSTLRGDGQQFGESVHFEGTGTGTLQYELDPAGGEMLGASGTSVLEFTMQSRLRTQRVQQAATITVLRVP